MQSSIISIKSFLLIMIFKYLCQEIFLLLFLLLLQMDWVCDKDHQPYESQTIFYIGTSIGCIIFGLIADR